MFEKGNYIVNSNNGVCEISDIVTMNMGSGDKEYYVLIPIEERTAKVFIPVDMAENQLYSELAFALRVQKSELNRIIEQNIK